MVEIKKEQDVDLDVHVQCMICTSQKPKASWAIISPTKPFFEDVAAWVSQISDTKNIIKKEEDMVVEIGLCEHHDILMNRLLPKTHQSKKEILGAFQHLIEYEKN